MKLSKIIFVTYLLIYSSQVLSQQGGVNTFNGISSYYSFPIQPGVRNYLAGTMGELRTTHFHAGLDIKTNGVEGLPVHVTATGHVARIKIAEGGYGNALYVLHPNGTTSVYAHLSKFEDKIGRYIREAQYRNESFAIELFPKPGEFKYEKGDIIAYSGNTGSSGGPHLHFEIRDHRQDVLNPLYYDFNEIMDRTAPSISKLALVPLHINSRVNRVFEREEITPVRNGNHYSINRKIIASGEIGLEILAYDRQDGTNNRNGIQLIELLVDSVLIFKQHIDKFSFAETRNVLALTNYEIMVNRRARFNKLYLDDGNELSFYSSLKNKGKIVLNDQTHHIQIMLTDSYGNQSDLSFEISGETLPVGNHEAQKYPSSQNDFEVIKSTLMFNARIVDEGAPFATIFANRMKYDLTPSYYKNNRAIYLWNLGFAVPDSIDICGEITRFGFKAMVPSGNSFHYYDKHFDISFPKRALFDTLFLTSSYKISEDTTREYFTFGPEITPMRSYATILLKPKRPYGDKNKVKAYKVIADKYTSYEGGEWIENKFKIRTRELGTYTLIKDDVAPKITPLRINSNHISFKIEDEMSGISKYRLEVDGKWVLLHYDYKRNLLWSEKLDNSRPFQGEVILKVEDNCENINEYKTKI